MRLSFRQGSGRPSGPARGPLHTALLAALALGPALAAGCNRKPQDLPRPDTSARPASVSSAAASAAARAAAGALDFAAYCALCHGADAKGYAADYAPSLVTETFLASATDAFLIKSIREGRPGTAMAGYARAYGGPLTDDAIAGIVAFLRTKGPEPVTLPAARAEGAASKGQEIYDRECVRCHGTRDTHGVAVQLSNTGFLSAASDDFIRYAITNGRPGTPMVAFGSTLAPDQIESLVAMLRTWATPMPRRPDNAPEVPLGPVVINPKGKQASFTARENRFVPAADVKKALDAKQRIVLIDARAASDWIMAHIPGAISVPYYQFTRLDALPKDGTWIIAYCACPHHASGVVVDELRKRGFSNTAILDEGIIEWQRRGYPIEGTAPLPPASASAKAAPGASSARPAASAPPRVKP